jgi:ankyrin repeat protein
LRPFPILWLCLGALSIPTLGNAAQREAAPRVTPSPQQKNSTLIEAVQAGDAPYVKQLLREGADPNERLLWQRATSIDEYMPATAPALYLALGWSPNNGGCHSAMVHARHRLIDARRDVVAALLRAGADSNVTGDIGLTPLAFAVQHNPTAIVKLLLDAGAKVKQDPTDLSLLHRAAINYRDEAAELLLRRGADPNSRDARGLTPLAWGASPGLYAKERPEEQIRFVRVMLKYGADPLTFDKDNGAPLGAALASNPEVLRLLLFAEAHRRREKEAPVKTRISVPRRQEL